MSTIFTTPNSTANTELQSQFQEGSISTTLTGAKGTVSYDTIYFQIPLDRLSEVQIRESLSMEVLGSTLCQNEFFQRLVKMWHSEFQSIVLINR